jgi:hypothetical protein
MEGVLWQTPGRRPSGQQVAGSIQGMQIRIHYRRKRSVSRLLVSSNTFCNLPQPTWIIAPSTHDNVRRQVSLPLPCLQLWLAQRQMDKLLQSTLQANQLHYIKNFPKVETLEVSSCPLATTTVHGARYDLLTWPEGPLMPILRGSCYRLSEGHVNSLIKRFTCKPWHQPHLVCGFATCQCRVHLEPMGADIQNN